MSSPASSPPRASAAVVEGAKRISFWGFLKVWSRGCRLGGASVPAAFFPWWTSLSTRVYTPAKERGTEERQRRRTRVFFAKRSFASMMQREAFLLRASDRSNVIFLVRYKHK
jgi:hypothetical protein